MICLCPLQDDLSLSSSELLLKLELCESSTRDSSDDMNKALALALFSLSKVVDWRKTRKRAFAFYNINVSKYT